MADNPPILYNATRNTTLAHRVEIADSMFTRLRGLMFRSSLPPGEALWLVPCKGIHMGFMRFPIDVIFLDPHQVVVRIIHNLRPWRVSPIVRGAASALELPAGTLGDRVAVGDLLYIGPVKF